MLISDRPAPMPDSWCCGVKYSDGGHQQAAGKERESNPTVKRLHVGFILKQIVTEMFCLPSLTVGVQKSQSRMFFWMVGQLFARGSIKSKCPAPGSGISLAFLDALAKRWLISNGTTLSAVPCTTR